MEQYDGITILKQYALARKKRIQPCQIYDANVSTSIMNEETGWHLRLVSGHLLSHQIHMTYRRRRVHVAASEEYISLQVDGRLDVGVCSINCVNRVSFVNVPTTLRVSGDPRWPIFVPRTRQQSETLSDFLDLPSVHSMVAAVINSQNDSLHIFNGAICLYFQPDSAEALQLALESISELVGARARMTRASLRSLPECFEPLIPLIQKWAEGDDSWREEMLRRASKTDLARLLETVSPHLGQIDNYLAMNDDEGACALGRLAELTAEVRLRINKRES